MSKYVYTLSHEALEYLVGLIRNTVSSPSEIISDLTLASNQTFSSVRIDALLKALKTDCNDYTDKLVSNLSRLKLKIVTDEADITESNTMYLYKPDGTTSYNQYVVIEGNKVLLGTCDIDMSDYYTITETDNKFALKTTTDTLTTEVTNIKSDLTTHTDDTDIHITANERAKWNNATNEEKIKEIVDGEMTTKGVCTTKVADVPITVITDRLVSAKVSFPNNDSFASYYVKNGICYITIWSMKINEACSVEVLFQELPKSAVGITAPLCNEQETFAQIFIGTSSSNVAINANANLIGKSGYCSFSYPVVES